MSSRSTSPSVAGSTVPTLVPWPSQLFGLAGSKQTAAPFDMQAYLKLLRQQRSKAAAQMPTPPPVPASRGRIQKSAKPALRRSQRLRRAQQTP